MTVIRYFGTIEQALAHSLKSLKEEEVKAAYAEADTDIAEDFSESFNPGKTSLYEQIDLAWEEKFGKRQMPWAWGKLREYTIDPALEQYNNFNWIANLTKGFKK